MKLRTGSYYEAPALGFDLICADNTESPTSNHKHELCFACGKQTKYMLLCWGNFNDGKYRIHCTNCVPPEQLKKGYYRFA